MPLLAELSSTSNISDNIHSIQIVHEDQVHEVEGGSLRVAESTVAVQDGRYWLRRSLVEGGEHTLLPDEEHGNLGAIRALVPGLVSSEVGKI